MLDSHDSILGSSRQFGAVDTIPAALGHWAELRHAERFCTFIAGSYLTEVTFGQLYDRSLGYARYYQDRGIQPGDLIIIILQHSEHLFYSYLGAILMGAVPSFLPFPSTKQRHEVYWSEHRILFDRIKPALIITYEKNVDLASQCLQYDRCFFGVASDEIIARTVSHYELVAASPRDIACMQHTSGTTGSKKGVMLTHRAILEAVDAYSASLDFRASDIVVSWLPLYHDMGFIACFLLSVINGTHLVSLDPFEWVARPARLLDAIEKYGASFCWLPNFAFAHIVNTVDIRKTWNLSSIRAFINCSEPCRVESMQRFVDRLSSSGITEQSVRVCYALAENVFGVTQTLCAEPLRIVNVDSEAFRAGVIRQVAASGDALQFPSCGRPLKGVQLRIDGISGNKCGEGEIGQISISSTFLFSGYYLLPEKTRRALRNGWYATGDLGFMVDGELYITGRIDDMIVVNGKNFYAHEIELVVQQVAGIVPGRAVALAVTEPRVDATVVVLLVECTDDVDVNELKRKIRQRSLDVLTLSIDSIVILPRGELIKTTSGKISRRRNLEQYLAAKRADLVVEKA